MKLSASELGWVIAVICAALLVAALLYWPATKDTPKPAAPKQDVLVARPMTLPPKAETYKVIGWRKGLRNYVVQYNDRLYRGGRITGNEGLEALRGWGVKTVISIVPDDEERRRVRAAGMKLVEVPFDRKTGLPPKLLAKFLQAVRTEPGPFYLHCLAGCQRAGTLAAAYRIHVEGWDFHKAAVEFGRLGGNLKKDHRLLESIKAGGTGLQPVASQPAKAVRP